jgi:hypothetical protein
MLVSMAFKAIVACILFPVVAAGIYYPETFAELTDRNLQDENCHDCGCFTCDNVEKLDNGMLEVTIGHCKDSPISWMCCVGLNDLEGNCKLSPGTCTGVEEGAKCNTVEKNLKVTVPDDTYMVAINTHDGKTKGDGIAINSVCGGNGNQGGSCAKDGATAHCMMYFMINECSVKKPSAPTPAEVPAPTPDKVPAPTVPAPVAVVPAPTPGGAGGDPVGVVIDGRIHES